MKVETQYVLQDHIRSDVVEETKNLVETLEQVLPENVDIQLSMNDEGGKCGLSLVCMEDGRITFFRQMCIEDQNQFWAEDLVTELLESLLEVKSNFIN